MAEKDKNKDKLELQDDLDAVAAVEEETEEKSKSDKKSKQVKKKPGLGSRISKWFRELRSEAKKIVWPTFGAVAKNTGIVLVTIAIIALFIAVFDFLITHGNQALFNLVKG